MMMMDADGRFSTPLVASMLGGTNILCRSRGPRSVRRYGRFPFHSQVLSTSVWWWWANHPYHTEYRIPNGEGGAGVPSSPTSAAIITYSSTTIDTTT